MSIKTQFRFGSLLAISTLHVARRTVGLDSGRNEGKGGVEQRRHDRVQAKNLAAEQPDRVARRRAEIGKWFATLPRTVDPPVQSTTGTKPAAKTRASAEGAPASPATLTAGRTRAFGNWDKNRDAVLRCRNTATASPGRTMPRVGIAFTGHGSADHGLLHPPGCRAQNQPPRHCRRRSWVQ